ncbi:galactose oxidase [Klebsormidium nitens]|uniref:Galactose oxidase n=1 Tax=Klebsormidium nitens TaxID=105231 RepID=A0A1Y1I7X2_KLENI|nr:galactose oxidase [Klebsormidium nitens]|eukprot:GAQ86633.1 galactose oxidase [Klebsormidium nitens]
MAVRLSAWFLVLALMTPFTEGAPNSTGETIHPNLTPGLVSTAGKFAVLNHDIGISPMHGTPVPFTNKVLMIDRTDPGPSKLHLSDGTDAYAGEFDLDKNSIRAVSVPSNTWCSAGAYLPDGTILNNGGGDGSGGFEANSGLRTFTDGGNLVQVSNTKVPRWYPTAHVLPDGRVLMVGGSDKTQNGGGSASYASYEFYPADGQDAHPLELLARPNVVAANLYPFVHLIPDGRMFIFAAKSSVLLDYNTGTTTDLPDLPGNYRNYPLAGASILLPLDYKDSYTARVMVCGGGNGQVGADNQGDPSAPASASCGTIDLSHDNPKWAISSSATVSSDGSAGVLWTLQSFRQKLPNHGSWGTWFTFWTARVSTSTAVWWASRATIPPRRPSIYDPTHDTWQQVESKSDSARLYHAVAYLIPDGRVLIHGSNPRPNYDFGDASLDVTQTSVEAFSPWYIGTKGRPTIAALSKDGALGGTFDLTVAVPSEKTVDPTKIRVALINPGFATHTVSMNQRYVRLALVGADGNALTVRLPTNAAVLPPGPYLCTVLYRGIPSESKWFTMKK